MLHNKCGWCGTWDDFFNIDEKEFILKLKYFYSELPWVNEIGQAHCLAWKHEYHALQNTLRGVVADTIINPSSCYLVFEHELTGEAGKRLADANIILPTGDFIIVEFKHKLSVDEVEVDRLNTDLNYISKFHSESINLNNHAFLAITNPNANFQIKNTKFQLDIIKGGLLNGLKNFLIRLINNRPLDSYDASRWLEGRYYRQPSILYGTVKAFFDGELPNLKGEAQENIKEVRNCLLNIYKDARHHKKRYVVMVNGRPGAGKTLLGISMVADLIKEYGAEQLQPVLLSGNVPLVNVLRYTLDYYAETQHQTQKINIQGRSLIEHLKDFRSSMKSNSRASQHLENFIVFDEAQRAWKEQSSNHSYQTQLDQLCAWLNQKDHGVLLLLVGDGQAIYNKEMPTDQMIKALDSAVSRYRDNMSLIIPLLHQDLIKNAPYLICDHLYLKNPIRQIYTDHLADWIEAVLAADHKAAKQISLNMHGEYPLYVCRTKALADNCARRLFNQHHEDCNEIGLSKTPFRMGWFISNKGGALQDLGEVPRDNAKIMGAWYVNAPTSDQSCCELKTACNEFGCQGLELSIALVHWGKDLLFRNGSLELSSESKYRRKLEFYTWGVYRVLLSRGRNALIIMADDAETYEFLKKCGMESCN